MRFLIVSIAIITAISCTNNRNRDIENKSAGVETEIVEEKVDVDDIPFLVASNDYYKIDIDEKYYGLDFKYSSLREYLNTIPVEIYDEIKFLYFSNTDAKNKIFNNLDGIELLSNLVNIKLISDQQFINSKLIYKCEKLSVIGFYTFQESSIDFNKFKNLRKLTIGELPSVDYFYNNIPLDQLVDLNLKIRSSKMTDEEYLKIENVVREINPDDFLRRIVDLDNPKRYMESSMEGP